jgi:hypothetical protein
LNFVDLDLDLLNGGNGIQTTNGTDARINLKDGTSFDADFSTASTVQDVLDIINSHTGNPGTLTASVPAGQNRIQLVDTSGGLEISR